MQYIINMYCIIFFYNSVSPKLIVSVTGTTYTDMNTTGMQWLIVVAENEYGGMSSATMPVECLPSSAATLQLAGGYDSSTLGVHYDCRISKGSFSGRNAWSNGVNYVSHTKWYVYCF